MTVSFDCAPKLSRGTLGVVSSSRTFWTDRDSVTCHFRDHGSLSRDSCVTCFVIGCSHLSLICLRDRIEGLQMDSEATQKQATEYSNDREFSREGVAEKKQADTWADHLSNLIEHPKHTHTLTDRAASPHARRPAQPSVRSDGSASSRRLHRELYRRTSDALSSAKTVSRSSAIVSTHVATGRAGRDAGASVSPAHNHRGRRVPLPRRSHRLPLAVALPVLAEAPITRSRDDKGSLVTDDLTDGYFRVPSASRVTAGDLDS